MANHPRPAPPPPGRQAAAGLAAAAVAALGALILGEYEFNGATPYLAGILFGLVVAEVILTIARSGTGVLVAAAAGEAGLGLLWAAWISSGRGLTPIPAAGYAAVGLGAAVAGGWVRLPPRRTP
ncbi:MAG TPA: hypothetical protein VGI06_01290 [Acidimicrobiales bacterium]